MGSPHLGNITNTKENFWEQAKQIFFFQRLLALGSTESV